MADTTTTATMSLLDEGSLEKRDRKREIRLATSISADHAVFG